MPLSRLSAAAAALLLGGHAYADTLVTSQAAFNSAVTNATQTTSLGLQYYTTTNTVTLADDTTLNLTSPLGDEVGASGIGFAPFTNGYAGDILITNSATETIDFASPLTAFGLLLAPDVALTLNNLFQNQASFLITLSNGQTTTISGNYNPGDSSFFGFYGAGDISWVSITVSGTNGINGSPITDFALGDFQSVPEPASLAVLGAGLTALAFGRRRTK